jgi:hypothetical protein
MSFLVILVDSRNMVDHFESEERGNLSFFDHFDEGS